jgi:hypothetical protein
MIVILNEGNGGGRWRKRREDEEADEMGGELGEGESAREGERVSDGKRRMGERREGSRWSLAGRQ